MVDTVCQNWHTSHRDFYHLLAQFPTPLPLFPSPGIALESPWEDNRLIVFWLRGKDRSDLSPHLYDRCLSIHFLMEGVVCLFLSLPFFLCLHLSLCFLFLSSLFLCSPPQFLLLFPFLCRPCLFSCSLLCPLLLLFLPEPCLCLFPLFYKLLLVPFIIGVRHSARVNGVV